MNRSGAPATAGAPFFVFDSVVNLFSGGGLPRHARTENVFGLPHLTR